MYKRQHLNDVLHEPSNVVRQRLDISALSVPMQLPPMHSPGCPFTPNAAMLMTFPPAAAPDAVNKRKRPTKTKQSVATDKKPPVKPPGKKQREKKPLPTSLKNVKTSDRDKFLHRAEDSDVAGEVVEVCCAIKADGETVEMSKLNLDQMRRLCMFFGIKGAGQFNTMECKHELCEFSHLQHCCANLPNPNQSAGQLRSSTLLRLVNVAFLPDFYGRLRDINDIKKRKDCEGQSGERNPLKAFWAEMSDCMNDTENDGVVGIAAECHLNEEDLPPEFPDGPTLSKLVDADQLDPKTFSQVTGAWCQQNFKDLMTARANVAKAMGASGHHCNVLGECMKRSFCEARKKHWMPFAPACCTCQHCDDHTDLDAAFAAFMEDGLKSDSAKQGNIGKESNAKGKSTRKKEIDQLKDAMKESTDAIASEMKEANSDRKKIAEALNIEARNKAWDLEDRKWTTLTSLSNQFEETFEKTSGKGAALRPLSLRIQTLEKDLHEPDNGSMFDDDLCSHFKVN